MIEVIEEKEVWDKFVSNFGNSDFYHSFDYHMIAKGDGKPVILKYSIGETCVGLPLLIRKIPNSPFYDATSVYGYPGPLCENIEADFNSQLYANKLLEYFIDHKIISVFSRLNPFIQQQHKVLEKIGILEKKGVIVSIDLTKDVELQRKDFGRRLKGQLNKIRRNCYAVKAGSNEDFQDFIKLYRENMDRVGARSAYYFNDEYFNVLAKSTDFHTETLLAKHMETGKTIGAGMFIYKDSTVHYHLSGTRSDSLPLMPIKLLIDEMRIKATELGLKNFNLGGGLSSANDSLLQFKSSFSKNKLQFCVWKLIVMPNVYQEIAEESTAPIGENYFPLYRYCSEIQS